MKKTIKKEVEVFDLRKYIDVCLANGQAAVEIVNNIKYWALKYNGATRQELVDKCYHIHPDWCIKKEAEIEVPINELCANDEKTILRCLPKEYLNGWIVRQSNTLILYDVNPLKDGFGGWALWFNHGHSLELYNHLFLFIQQEDEEPYKISELIG